MSFRSFSRIRVLAISLAAATATTTLFAIAGAAGPAAAATSNGCPATKTLAGLPTASNVAASFTNSGSVSTYTFSSTNETSTSLGVPGLIKYCVYPTPSALPSAHTVAAVGANGAPWVYSKGSNNFAFVRPGGDKTNIPFDGKTITMGTATWGTVPTGQTIILHINDPTVCQRLFPGSITGTCFVKPSTSLGPRCDTGDTTVAYNDMPFDVVNCLNPGVAFEAHPWNEFGDEVGLTGSARTLVALKVDFQSFACENGQWNGVPGDPSTPEPCSTTPGDTFQWPITANIYDPNGSGGLTTPIATVTVTQTIPYRPSADTTGHCTGSVGNKWWNPDAIGGGACQNSIATVLTFNFPSGTVLPNTVVWTVAFNTSDFGAKPQSPQACNTGPDINFPGLGDGGCPYDSLNVGDHSLPNAPYAGTSLFDTNGGLAAGSQSQPPPSALSFFPTDDNGRPLGEIITS
jgi:hypothetical protein